MRRILLLLAVLAVLAAAAGCPEGAPPVAPPAAPPVAPPPRFRPTPPGPLTEEVREARERAIREEIARIGVVGEPALAALRAVDRRWFLDPDQQALAWEDRALRRADGETITAPDLSAAMLASLGLTPESRVLECGTRTGWMTALLAMTAGEVFSVSSSGARSGEARDVLSRIGIANVRYRVGDPAAGWPEEAPFDAVLVNGRVDHVPRALYESLRPGGRILAPVGPEGESQTLLLLVRGDEEPRLTRPLLPVRFGPLR